VLARGWIGGKSCRRDEDEEDDDASTLRFDLPYWGVEVNGRAGEGRTAASLSARR
jgi:hypothetical protein